MLNNEFTIHRDLFIEIHKKKNKLVENYIDPRIIIFSADLYLLFCNQCAQRARDFKFIKDFDGMEIIVIPGSANYLEVIPKEFEQFMQAFPSSIKGIKKVTVNEMEKELGEVKSE